MRPASQAVIGVFKYAGVIAVAILCTAISLHTLIHASVGMPTTSPRAKTLLDLQVESAREIRAALDRPQVSVDPLPPITAKLARSQPSPNRAADKRTRFPAEARSGVRLLSAEARNSFALSEWSASSKSSAPPLASPSYPTADRHGLR
jgi:hypothetical protein